MSAAQINDIINRLQNLQGVVSHSGGRVTNLRQPRRMSRPSRRSTRGSGMDLDYVEAYGSGYVPQPPDWHGFVRWYGEQFPHLSGPDLFHNAGIEYHRMYPYAGAGGTAVGGRMKKNTRRGGYLAY